MDKFTLEVFRIGYISKSHKKELQSIIDNIENIPSPFLNKTNVADTLKVGDIIELMGFKYGVDNKIEIKEKKIIKVNDIFSVTLEDNKIYHKEDNITRFVESITSNFKNYIIGGISNCASLNGYDVSIKDIIFSQTGCEHNETTLSQWINVWDEYLEFNK